MLAMPELTFSHYARRRMHRRHVPEAAVYHIVADADEVIERDDDRIEYIGVWEGQACSLSPKGKMSPSSS